MQGAEEAPLVIPYDQKNQNIKQKWYCNKFSKDFKNCMHPKKKFQKRKKQVIGLQSNENDKEMKLQKK